MTRAIILAMVFACFFVLTGLVSASILTLDQNILQSLYQTDENPRADPGTELFSVTPAARGAEYWGMLNMGGNGWSQIQVGANYLGCPFAGEPSTGASLGELGLGNLSGYTGFSQSFLNNSKHTWQVSLFAKFGYEHSGEAGFLMQTSWNALAVGGKAVIDMDFTDINVWSIDTDNGEKLFLGRMNAFDLGINWSHVSSLGFNFGGDVPVAGDGHNFKIAATPIPEPATLFIIGFGLLGLGIAHKRIQRNSSREL